MLFRSGLLPTTVVLFTPGQRIGQLSADGYLQPFWRLELYSRAAWLHQTSNDVQAHGTTTYLLQTRAQFKLLRRLDAAYEARWVNETTSDLGARHLGALELGVWISKDLRLGIGYTEQPWLNQSVGLFTNPGRGGPYVVLSSRFASLFDLLANGAPRSDGDRK